MINLYILHISYVIFLFHHFAKATLKIPWHVYFYNKSHLKAVPWGCMEWNNVHDQKAWVASSELKLLSLKSIPIYNAV